MMIKIGKYINIFQGIALLTGIVLTGCAKSSSNYYEPVFEDVKLNQSISIDDGETKMIFSKVATAPEIKAVNAAAADQYAAVEGKQYLYLEGMISTEETYIPGFDGCYSIFEFDGNDEMLGTMIIEDQKHETITSGNFLEKGEESRIIIYCLVNEEILNSFQQCEIKFGMHPNFGKPAPQEWLHCEQRFLYLYEK